MRYTIRPATLTDIPHIAQQRELMFREMGIPAAFEAMGTAMDNWLRDAIPAKTYQGWVAVSDEGHVVAGGGLVVIPWPPGPISMDPRCGFVFNVYTDPSHRHQGLARRLMDTIHEWCRGEGLERLVLNASTFGQPLYESMGYVATNEPMMRIRL
jgi:GNAT superfamily N-acetyltransferase